MPGPVSGMSGWAIPWPLIKRYDMNTESILTILLLVAGTGQVFIALVYDWVRRILGWDADIARMRYRWNRQIAHTYSRYIQGINAFLGAMTLLYAEAFLYGHAIVNVMALGIALYWGIRLLVAVGYYDTRAVTAQRRLYRIGGWGFNLLFAYLAGVYASVFVYGMGA